MPFGLSIAPRRRPAAPSRGDVGQGSAPDDILTCVLAFAAAGLFASCVALGLAHDSPTVALIELIVICAAPPLAGLVALRMMRRH